MSKARNRDRRPARREEPRDTKPIVLVVTEGRVTEREYLLGFERAYQNAKVTVKVAPGRGVPRTLVECAREGKQDVDAYDSVWCVFDIDEHPDVGEAVEMARDNGIDLAISNPCFELWLLLHFQGNPGLQNHRQMKTLLRRHVPGYNKHVDYATYAAGYDDAVRRAERMDQEANDAGESYRRNPTTGVYRLTELIRGE